MKKKRNPTDITLRNLRSVNKKIKALDYRVKSLERRSISPEICSEIQELIRGCLSTSKEEFIATLIASRKRFAKLYRKVK